MLSANFKARKVSLTILRKRRSQNSSVCVDQCKAVRLANKCASAESNHGFAERPRSCHIVGRLAKEHAKDLVVLLETGRDSEAVTEVSAAQINFYPANVTKFKCPFSPIVCLQIVNNHVLRRHGLDCHLVLSVTGLQCGWDPHLDQFFLSEPGELYAYQKADKGNQH